MTPLGAGHWLGVGDDLGRISEVQDAILAAFAWALGLVVVLGGAGGVWLSRAFLRRVDAIGRTAEAIIAGDLARRIPVRGTGDDLDRLAGTLNRMLDRITALMESLRQVSADVAHDLRTPLTRLMQQLDTARTACDHLGAYRDAVDAAVVETEAILATFAALLRIAQVEGGSRRAAFREVDLSALTASLGESYAPSIEAADHRFAAAIAPGVRIEGDAPVAHPDARQSARQRTAPYAGGNDDPARSRRGRGARGKFLFPARLTATDPPDVRCSIGVNSGDLRRAPNRSWQGGRKRPMFALAPADPGRRRDDPWISGSRRNRRPWKAAT